MGILTPESLHDALIVAQRVRICELESELRQVAESLHRAERTVREVLEGAGASPEERVRADVAMAEVRGLLQQALTRPIDREGARGMAGADRPADPGAPSGVVLPLRRDLGVRFARRSIFADADANKDETP